MYQVDEITRKNSMDGTNALVDAEMAQDLHPHRNVMVIKSVTMKTYPSLIERLCDHRMARGELQMLQNRVLPEALQRRFLGVLNLTLHWNCQTRLPRNQS